MNDAEHPTYEPSPTAPTWPEPSSPARPAHPVGDYRIVHRLDRIGAALERIADSLDARPLDARRPAERPSLAELERRRDLVLEAVRVERKATVRDLMRRTGLTEGVARTAVDALVDDGVVRNVGSRKVHLYALVE